MMMRIPLIIFAFLIVVVFSCSKSGGVADDGDGEDNHVVTPTDVTAPVITISGPAAGQQFASGSSRAVTGKITDDYGLYRGNIRFVNDATGEVLKQQAYEIHGYMEYNYSLTHVISAPGNYTATVAFEDHGLNSTSASVKFKVNP